MRVCLCARVPVCVEQAPAAAHKGSQKEMDETFSLTNISPQVGKGFNRWVGQAGGRAPTQAGKQDTLPSACTVFFKSICEYWSSVLM